MKRGVLLYDNLLKYAFYSITINLIFAPLSTSVSRIFGYISLILFFVYPIISSLKKGKLNIKKEVVILAILVLVATLTSIKNLFPINFDDLRAWIIAIVSLLAFYWSISLPVSKDSCITIDDLLPVNYMLCAMYIIYAFGPFDFKYEVVNEYNDKIFTLGLGNPNGTSFCILFSVAILCLAIFSQKKIINRVVNISLIAVLIVILLMLSSRTVVLCVLVLMVFLIFRFKFTGKFIPYLALIIPIIAVLFQISLGNLDFDYQILGKAISTGRNSIYSSLFESVKENPWLYIFGNMCEYRFTNLHNGILTIFSSLGLIGLAVYLYFWFKQITFLKNIVYTKIQYIAFVTILVFIIHSSSETMSIIGTVPHSLFVLIFTKISKGDIVFKNERITKNPI